MRMTDPQQAQAFRSATIHDGLIRATTRSFLYALGQDDEDIARPHIGVFHTGGEMSPCNMNLRDQAQHAKTGIYAGGGMPHECPVVSVSDGLTMAHSGMRFSLISRELIADSVEASTRGHQWDGIFAIGACDKNLPGLMMGMVRCNVPACSCTAAPRCRARCRGRRRDLNVVDTYETIGKVLAGDGHRRRARASEPRLPADRRRLRRPVHRQHHGHGVRGAGPGADRLVAWCRPCSANARR